MPEMRILFFIAAGLNSVAITIVPICTIFLAYYSSSRVVSISYSIALIQGLIMISGIVGSWLGATPHKLRHTFATLAKEGNYGRGFTSFNSF